MSLRWDTGLKWDKTNLIALVSVVFTFIPFAFYQPKQPVFVSNDQLFGTFFSMSLPLL